MSKPIAAIKISNLKKSYKGGNIQALDDISFTVDEGETFGLIGPNGAGKTTLIGCVLALLAPDSGQVRIFGKPADYISVLKQTGYMPERVMFEHWMTGHQFLEFHHGLSKLDPRSRESDVHKALDMVKLSKQVAHRKLKTYSRGMLQRLNLAQVLIGNPRLILLDEPTLGLDPDGVNIVRTIVKDLHSKGTTFIINSHQLDEIERLCSRVAMIRNGKIISIKNMFEDTCREYLLNTSWSNCHLNGTLIEAVNRAATNAGCQIKGLCKQSGSFLVKDKSTATRLIKALIQEGVCLEEARADRRILENMFSGSAEASIHE